MNIRRGDFVLEIGSGHNPRPRADVLCDRFIEDDTQRGGSIVTDRPLIEADARALPFADKAFDYVICSHVLEHVTDPARMLGELARVGSRGYIETPSEVAERLYGWPFHESVINLIGGRLVIRRKTFTPPFGELFHVLAARDPEFSKFHRTHGDLLLVRYEWEGKIDYEILAQDASPLDLTRAETVEELWRSIRRPSGPARWLAAAKSVVPRPVVAWGKSLLAGGRRGSRRDWRRIVVCPACRGPVTWEEAKVTCTACGLSYPIVGGIPRLVPPALA
jgi:uncharacterized protein YbaR (Trm112 family)/SAM-dependent methyltransferase